jgi:hypothetical protein
MSDLDDVLEQIVASRWRHQDAPLEPVPRNTVELDSQLFMFDGGIVSGPAAAIVAAIGVAVKTFSDLFRGLDDIEDLLKDGLRDIQGELDKLNRTLQEILAFLRDLDERLREGFRQDAEADVFSIVMQIASNEARLTRERATPGGREAIDQLLMVLQRANYKLSSYGYAGAVTVAFGVRAELQLFALREGTRADAQRTLRYYQNFFQNAINPHVPNSLAEALQRTEADMEAMRQQYQPGVYYLDRPFWYRSYEARHTREGEHYKTILLREHFKAEVSGSVETDFTVRLVDGDIYQDSSRDASEYANSRDLARSVAEQHLASTTRATYSNAVRAFSELRSKRAVLTSAIKGCSEIGQSLGALVTKWIVEYRALCIEKREHKGHEYPLTEWMSSEDEVNVAGKKHEQETKGHRWRIETREP